VISGTSTPPLSIHAWLRFAAIQRLLHDRAPQSVLEIGVGQGSLGALLARRYDYVGIELDATALSTARTRFARLGLDPLRLLHGDLTQVESRVFDLVCAFEVLEHFDNDRGTLEEWRPFVAVGGALLISVPADPSRFGAADEKAGHFRRYSRDGIERVLTSAGFVNVRILNYGYPAAYVLEAARNVLARRELRKTSTQMERTLASGRWLQPREWMAPLTHAASVPFELLQRPFMKIDRGTGLVAIANRA
jgi:SAM-dependent methyltransferase